VQAAAAGHGSENSSKNPPSPPPTSSNNKRKRIAAAPTPKPPPTVIADAPLAQPRLPTMTHSAHRRARRLNLSAKLERLPAAPDDAPNAAPAAQPNADQAPARAPAAAQPSCPEPSQPAAPAPAAKQRGAQFRAAGGLPPLLRSRLRAHAVPPPTTSSGTSTCVAAGRELRGILADALGAATTTN
jgi:hypothetical protein